jgi:hypothetical protein
MAPSCKELDAKLFPLWISHTSMDTHMISIISYGKKHAPKLYGNKEVASELLIFSLDSLQKLTLFMKM